MKTTLEIPDAIFRRAKSVAAQRGIPLREFVTEAVKDRLAGNTLAGHKPWVNHMGKLKRLPNETLHINRLIEDDSEKNHPQMWRRSLTPPLIDVITLRTPTQALPLHPY